MRTMLIVAILIAAAPSAFAQVAGDPERGKQRAVICFACHGPDGQSMSPEYPNLAGQKAQYLVTQLTAFRTGERKNPLMTPMVAQLDDQDVLDVAAFFSSQVAAAAAAATAPATKQLPEVDARYERRNGA